MTAGLKATIGTIIWATLGTNNIEAKKHILYSLGAQNISSVFKNNRNGEVIRLWGTPIFDQWSGLGNRLPTQSFLTDSPLGLLANFFTLDFIVFFYIFLSFWFLFFVSHEWINKWITKKQNLFAFLYDMAILGLTSFYTIFHEWSPYIITISGAMVCFLTLTNRSLIENRPDFEIKTFVWRISIGTLMIGLPHIGYGMTFLPTIIFLTLFNLFRDKRALISKILQQPFLLPIPILLVAIYTPVVVESLRIQSSTWKNFSPEFGLFHYWGNENSSIKIFNSIIHTMLYPVLGIFIPEGYLSQASYLRSFAYNRTNFAGGTLIVFVLIHYLLAYNLRRSKAIFHIIVFFISLTLILQYTGPGNIINFWPTLKVFLSNSYYQYADLTLILVLIYVAMNWDCFFETNKNDTIFGKTLVLILSIGILSTISLLPFRIFHTVLTNNGMPRFSAAQILNNGTKQKNNQWVDQLVSENNRGAVRILASDFIHPEGRLSWFGLRYIENFRDAQFAPLQARVKLREQPALHSGKIPLSVDPYFNCNTSDTDDRLDFLSVTHFISDFRCNKAAINTNSMSISQLPIEKTENEIAIPAVSKLLHGETQQLTVENVSGNLYLIRPKFFHEWYYNTNNLTAKNMLPRNPTATPCPFLENNCIEQLGLIQGSITTANPRFRLCKSNCLAHFDYSAEHFQGNFKIIIPISYDATIVALDINSQKLQLENFNGLIAFDTFAIPPGKITFSIAPDLLMRLHAMAPIFFILLILYILILNSRSRCSHF